MDKKSNWEWGRGQSRAMKRQEENGLVCVVYLLESQVE